MKLLREILSLRALRQLLAGRRNVVRRYTVTVPAPLDRPSLGLSAGSNVIELHSRTMPATSRASTHAATAAVHESAQLVLASSR